ncbi:hypothetical protein WA158_004513 [Blastocystis sp. Blastoise]
MKCAYLLLILCLLVPSFAQNAVEANCIAPNVYVHIRRQYKGNTNKEKMYIYEGETASTGVLKYTIDGNGRINQNDHLYYCLPNTVHAIVAYDGVGDGWATDSEFFIFIDDVEVMRGHLDRGDAQEWQFKPEYNLKKTATWKYSALPQTSTTWTTTAANDATWMSYAPGAFPQTPVGTARYYAASVVLPTPLTKYPIFEFGARTKDGLVLYVNGQEVYRYNMAPVVTPNPTDAATAVGSTDAYRIVTHSVRKFLASSAQVTLAAEIHPQAGALAGNDTFSGFFLMLYGDAIARTHDGSVTSNPDVTGDEGKDKAFDNDRETKWLSRPLDGNNSITYTFNHNKAEWINRYEITSANDAAGRDIKDFTLSGTNDDGVTWDLLDVRGYVVFSSRKETKSFDLPSNAKAYRSYKLTVQSIFQQSLNMLQIGEIEFYSVPMDIITGLKYEKTAYTWSANIDSVYVSPYSSGFKDYTCTSTLPAGISFISTTGEFYGTPTAAFTTQTIMVSATNTITGGIESTSMTFTVTECNPSTSVHIKIQKVTGGSTPYNERWEFYDVTNQLLASGRGIETDTATTHICIPYGSYTLKMIDTDSAGWNGASLLMINFVTDKDEFTVFRDFLYSSYSQTVPLKFNYALPYSSATAMARYDGVVPASWYLPTYTPVVGEWTAALAMNPRPSATASKLWLTRASVTITDKTSYHALEIRLIASGGTIVYWNGVEVSRARLPAGDITAASVTSATSISYEKKSITIPISQVTVGVNTLAILILLPTAAVLPSTFDVDYACRLVYESDSHSRTWSMSATHSDARSGEGSNLLVDGKFGTRWIADYNVGVVPSAWVRVAYNNGGAEFVNKYCLVSNYDLQNGDPISWTFSGCDADGNTCSILDTESEVVWKARSQRLCFYASTNTLTFASYKLAFTKNYNQIPSSSYGLAEIELLAVDLASIVVQPLTYTPNTLTGYKGIPFTNVIPTSGYRNFAVATGFTLPAGLYIDSSSGVIHGTPTVASTTPVTISITASTPAGLAASAMVIITISECSTPNLVFTIELYNEATNVGTQMGFELLDGATSQRIDIQSGFPDWSTSVYSYCRPQGTYNLRLTDAANDGWGSAYIRVLLKDGTEVVKSGLSTGQSPYLIAFDVTFLTSTEYSVWNFLNSAVIAAPTDNSWTQLAYVPSGWNSGTKDSFGVPQGITQYYRGTFTLASLNSQPAIQYTISLRTGAVIYLNGVEINRIHMPTGTITSTTLASTDASSNYSTGGSISTQFTSGLVAGTNVFAIEVHRGETVPTANYFGFICSVLAEGRYRIVDGTAAVKQYNYDYENHEMVFDNNDDSKWFSSSACVGNWATYTYNNDRKEFITSYSITDAKDCNVRHPSGWNVEGSNDNGVTWDMIHQTTDKFFTSKVQTLTFDMLPSKSYNKYRVYFTQCANSPFSDDNQWCTSANTQLSEIRFFIKTITNYCAATTDGWGPAVSNDYAYKACGQYYTGYSKKLCTNGVFGVEDRSSCVATAPTTFTYPESLYTFNVNTPITPIVPTIDATGLTFTVNFALPTGVLLDATTGTISGTPTMGANLGQYTITATNSAGTKEVTIQIVVNGGSTQQFCNVEGSWPITTPGSIATLPCPAGQTGSQTRPCLATSPPTWGSVTSTCTAAGGTVTLTYAQTTYTLSVGSIASIIPTTTGTINSWSISPLTLPSGLVFQNGVISGVPTVASNAQVYIITAVGTNTVTVTLTISVSTLTCPADGEWPVTARGATATLACPSQYQTGSRTRQCLNTDPATWAAEVNSCVYAQPVIAYNPATISTNINVAITPITPTITGYATSWTITPTLPSGLVFNTANGQISGTPVVAVATSSYLVTATNPNTSGTTSISITVINPQCAADGTWPITAAGQTASIACTDTQKEGQMTRICGSNAIWGAVNDACTYKAPVISGINSAYSIYKNDAFSLTPIVQYYVQSWTITPALPTGLTLNSQSGSINGAPTISTSLTSYTLTALNPNKQTNTQFTLIVNARLCSADGVWPQTEAGTTAYILCSGSTTAIRSRVCSLSGNTGVWGSEDNSLCVTVSSNDNPSTGRSFIKFPIRFTNINAAQIQGKQINAIRTSLLEYLSPKGIAMNGVVVESISDVNLYATGSQVVVRVDSDATTATTLKTETATYISNGVFLNTLRSKDTTFASSTVSVDTNSVSVTNHNPMTTGMIILIVVVVIFVVIAVAIVVFCIMNRTKSAKGKKANHKKLGTVPKAATKANSGKKEAKATKV